jgi:hypothetical protein
VVTGLGFKYKDLPYIKPERMKKKRTTTIVVLRFFVNARYRKSYKILNPAKNATGKIASRLTPSPCAHPSAGTGS